MLTEHRVLTEEERKELQPILEKMSVQKQEEVLRFVDTELDKVYDVYSITTQNRTRILKLLEERRFDKLKYDTYFEEKDLQFQRFMKMYQQMEKIMY